jgi:formylglycine-generating enzyme required for sulfatase activity
MGPDADKSLSNEATLTGRARPPQADLSIGDERTIGDGLSAQNTIIDDIEVIDLAARYRIDGTLGQGGMGAVLLATDTRLDRKIAIKRILGEAAANRMAVQRFLTEAKAIAALNHPNVVQIYDYGQAKDGPFLIMEYVDGGSLLDRCQTGPIALDEAIALACHICDGLAKAHDAGIIHRDIKPANVLLTKDGIPKLTDFGLAKAQAGDHGQTMTGAVLGTPDFMPPEQRRDASLVDHRSDLWSLAATVYQMVTGRSPKIIRFDLLPADLAKVLGKALEDAKEERFQSARELRDAFKAGSRVTAPTVEELAEGQCPSCGVKNDASRRFCRGCGESLEAPCLSCTKPIPMWEEICGSCGARQTQLFEARRQAMAGKQAEAEGLLGDGEFERATGIATQLRDESHPKLQYLSGWVQTFLAAIEKARSEQTRQAIEAFTEAGKHEAVYDYLSARVAIESIPESLHTTMLPGMQEPAAALLERVKKKQAEMRRLEGIIKERLATKQLDELLPWVERLLTLSPDRTDVQKIRSQLHDRRARQEAARDEAVAAAEASLASHDYEGAQAALATIAAAAVTPDAINLRKRTDDLVRRVRGLSKRINEAVAVKALDGLMVVVEEYLRLKPEDAEVETLRKSLEQREEKFATEIAVRFDQARVLLSLCQFDEAAKLLRSVPEPRRSPKLSDLLDQATRLTMLRGPALRMLAGATAGGYSAALAASTEYRETLACAECDDSECSALVTKVEAAAEQEQRTRRMLFVTAATAVGIVAVIALAVSGWWARSAYRASQVAAAIAQSSWEAALAIEPDNVAALVGRAEAKLAASPADVEGAFVDLARAEQQPGAAEVVERARAEAHATRAVEHAQAGLLDRAAEDLRAAKAGGAGAAFISRARSAIANGWLIRGDQAVAQDDAAAIRSATDSAAAAGAKSEAVLRIWREYVTGRIAKLDAKGLSDACLQAKKAGLTEADQAEWWIRFGETAASPPHENAAEVMRATDSAAAAGAKAEVVARLRSRGLLLEALLLQSQGDLKTAVSRVLAASLLDATHVQAMLEQPAYAPLRAGMVAEYRSMFDAAVSEKDWQKAFRIAEAAKTLDKASGAWVSQAVAALPPAATAALRPLRNSVGMELKLLPAGTFTMARVGGDSDEEPHEVILTNPFYLGVHEVTNAQWKRVMGSVPTTWQDDDRPVERVSWDDTVEFCRKLSALPEEQAAERAYRLPTEAEWEYACRAGTTTQYSYGIDDKLLGEYGWFDGNSGNKTHPVGEKRPNGWGLYDMHGNVWEWCSDWYGKYPDGRLTDPAGPSGGSIRVVRGGSSYNSAGSCRSADRNGRGPSNRHDYLGFRLALSRPTSESPEAGK